jgi:hypothetical protein
MAAERVARPADFGREAKGSELWEAAVLPISEFAGRRPGARSFMQAVSVAPGDGRCAVSGPRPTLAREGDELEIPFLNFQLKLRALQSAGPHKFSSVSQEENKMNISFSLASWWL